MAYISGAQQELCIVIPQMNSGIRFVMRDIPDGELCGIPHMIEQSLWLENETHMALDTHISTCFASEHTSVSTLLATEFLERIADNDDHAYEELQAMLKAYIDGKGFFEGPKGILFNWGYVGNYTNGEVFANTLREFLKELRNHACTGFGDSAHALVFVEIEGTESATCYEIKPNDDSDESYLVVVEHKDLPFCWGQY